MFVMYSFLLEHVLVSNIADSEVAETSRNPVTFELYIRPEVYLLVAFLLPSILAFFIVSFPILQMC